MKRRRWLAGACAHCLGLPVLAQTTAGDDAWQAPGRFVRPDLSTDEGGLWAMMDREETRMRRSPLMLRDAALREYLEGIACRLAGAHCPDIRVYPVRTAHFNASMAPNGMMQVWSGLLLRVDNEAQLAAVIGHEIGHYVQRHLLDRLRDAKSRSSFGLFLAMFGVVGLIGQLGMIAGLFGFSRDQEREADRIGMNLMRRAGYDTREAAKVWQNLHDELSAKPDGASRNALFATHPDSDERRQTLARMAEGHSGGELRRAEYEARVRPMWFDWLDDELRRGEPAETQVLLTRLIGQQPERAELYYFRGESRRLRDQPGDAEAALQDFNRAAALPEPPGQLFRGLGYLHLKHQRHPEAREAWTRYLQLMPQAPDAALIDAQLKEIPA